MGLKGKPGPEGIQGKKGTPGYVGDDGTAGASGKDATWHETGAVCARGIHAAFSLAARTLRACRTHHWLRHRERGTVIGANHLGHGAEILMSGPNLETLTLGFEQEPRAP